MNRPVKQTDMLDLAKAQTKEVYERQAAVWDTQRPRRLYERPWLDRFLNGLPEERARLLDLGCGAGDPLAGYFLSKGHEILGVDYSQAMIDLAKARFPNAEWLVQDMRALRLEGDFDGVYSWDGSFHLTQDEQRALIPALAARIRPGGAMMMTVGTGDGEVTGTVGGETVYHASLSPDEYRALLSLAGFDEIIFTPEDKNCAGRSILLATGKAG